MQLRAASFLLPLAFLSQAHLQFLPTLPPPVIEMSQNESAANVTSETESTGPPSRWKMKEKEEGGLDDVSVDDNKAECTDGEIVHHQCKMTCSCIKGSFHCKPKCTYPLVESSSTPPTNCTLNPTPDLCCSAIDCPVEKDIEKRCSYKNETYSLGQDFSDACQSNCTCMNNGEVSCKPRCPQGNNTQNNVSERCLQIQDENDPCCSRIYCDVNEHDDEVIVEDPYLRIISGIAVNSTAIELELASTVDPDFTVQTSMDNHSWTEATHQDNFIYRLKEGQLHFVRLILDNVKSNVISVQLPDATNGTNCIYKGKEYQLGQEFYDDCIAFCICTQSGIQCSLFKCPTDFGLDVLDPYCLEWENSPADFVPIAPKCCPDSVVCKSNGSCIFNGEMFNNMASLPESVTGCEKRCYCEEGNITCHERCSPPSVSPPPNLPCPPHSAMLSRDLHDDCCITWACPNHNHGDINHNLAGGYFPNHPHLSSNEIRIHELNAVDENTVRLVLSVPPVLVGLHGRVVLRYTSDKKNKDQSLWEEQILAPPNDLIATEELEFELGGLKPDTEYKLKVTLEMKNVHNSPSSDIVFVKTLPAKSTQTELPAVIPINPELKVSNVNSTRVELTWRKLTEYELQFIDGIQLRYKQIHGKVFQATPLIHRAVTSYTVEGLKPDSKYEVNIFFIPYDGQTTELQALDLIQFSTEIENDPYKFSLVLEVKNIKDSSVDVAWLGAPYPEDKYINIYRIIYQGDSVRQENNDFKIAKRDSTSGITIHNLKPNTRYRLWLEAYLTNGKKKKSNVQDFSTKQSYDFTSETNQGTLLQQQGSYYGALVGVSVFAAVAVTAAVGLLVILARKHGHNKAPISAIKRKPGAQNAAAYDNPSYKACENDGGNTGGRVEIPLEDTS